MKKYIFVLLLLIPFLKIEAFAQQNNNSNIAFQNSTVEPDSSSSLFINRQNERESRDSAILTQDTAIKVNPLKDPYFYDKVSLGIGLGMDYGGIGAKLAFYPNKYLGFYLSGGYNLNGLTYNAGVQARLFWQVKNYFIIPYISVGYGYNSVVIAEHLTAQEYYGMTFSAGIQYKSEANKDVYYSFGLTYGSETKAALDYIKYLESIGYEFKAKPLPIGISFGLHFILSRFSK